MADNYSIKQISQKTGLTLDALRYYEKIGLLPPAKRKENGHRFYHSEDMEVMELIICLKKIGVSLEDMKAYIPLSYKEDITSVPELHAKFLEYRQKIQAQVDEWQNVLKVIDYKLANNQSLLKPQTK
jgi:DNA-binding transcriptional MerR regulator